MVIDEAYAEFSGVSVMSLDSTSIRSFSSRARFRKLPASPGLRLGAVMACANSLAMLAARDAALPC